ncbi:MAG: hypothetical protein A4E67_00551 [Syntrophaceae bacterium PtaB.Bin038]|nr:MAG: hypothetical protein A4E67_00551 [Syntrophaceae bacterium PtaB.Bin038]
MSPGRTTLESVKAVVRGSSEPSWTWTISMRGLPSSRVALYSLSWRDLRAPPRVLNTAVYSGVSTRMSFAAAAALTGAAGAGAAGAAGTLPGAAAGVWAGWACVWVWACSCLWVSRLLAKKNW